MVGGLAELLSSKCSRELFSPKLKNDLAPPPTLKCIRDLPPPPTLEYRRVVKLDKLKSIFFNRYPCDLTNECMKDFRENTTYQL